MSIVKQMGNDDVIPLVQFFIKTPFEKQLSQFKKMTSEDSEYVSKFIKYGFEPVVESQVPCPKIDTDNAWVWVKGEEELKNDWENICFEDVFLLIRWNNKSIVAASLKIFVKNVIECLLGLREFPDQITDYQQVWLDRIKPEKSKMVVDSTKSSSLPIGYELEDGRKVSKFVGGPRADEINEMLKGLDTSFLIKKDTEMF